MERTLDLNSKEYDNLKLAAMMAEMISPNGYHYIVADTYFDFGQNWKWTTILALSDDEDSYQALGSIEWEQIITATEPEQILSAIRSMFADKYCPDRERR